MIIESLIGGSLLLSGGFGLYTGCRSLYSRLFRGASGDIPARVDASGKDPTPSFSVELVRTVLEHQARREDLHRQQLMHLVLAMAPAGNHDWSTSIALLRQKATDESATPIVKSNGGPVSLLRRLFHRT